MYHYRIAFVNPKCTGVNVYWDDVLMKKIVVRASYHGGNIVDFIEANDHYMSSFNFKQLSLY